MVSSGGLEMSVALKNVPSVKVIALAVLATNEPPTSNFAFDPKTMPLGLIRKRLALPKTPRVPRILEGLPPVTRLKMFSMPLGLMK